MAAKAPKLPKEPVGPTDVYRVVVESLNFRGERRSYLGLAADVNQAADRAKGMAFKEIVNARWYVRSVELVGSLDFGA